MKVTTFSDLELNELDIFFCSDKISIFSPLCSEGDSDIENAAVTSPHTSFVAESSTNFPAVSKSGDDINRYINQQIMIMKDFLMISSIGCDFRPNFTLAFSLHQ